MCNLLCVSVCCWLVVVDRCLLFVGCCSLFARCWLLCVGCLSLPVVRCSLLFVV